MFLHNDDVDVEAAAAAAAQAGVRVVRVLTAAAVETAVAHSHARAGALLVGVCMRASRENDLLARGMLLRVCVAGDSVRGPVFENLPPTNLARRLAGTSAPSLDAILSPCSFTMMMSTWKLLLLPLPTPANRRFVLLLNSRGRAGPWLRSLLLWTATACATGVN